MARAYLAELSSDSTAWIGLGVHVYVVVLGVADDVDADHHAVQQQIQRGDGRRSWTIVWPEGAEHREADRFLRKHDGSGTQRTYAYLLVDHLRWLQRECLALDRVALRDLERYMGILGAEVRMPLGEPWRVGKRAYGPAALSITAACLSAGIAPVLGVVVGTAVGLIAAYSRNWLDGVLMRLNDVLLAFPQIIFVLLAVSAIGPKLWLIVVTVGITHAPRVARVIRGAAQQIVERDFIKAEEVAGERRSRIIMQGLLPNVTSPLLVELGLRMTFSIGLVAAISFLGFGLQPPTADWGLMINENRLSITVMPWGVLLPVLAIAVLTVGTNLVTDGIARAAIGLERSNE